MSWDFYIMKKVVPPCECGKADKPLVVKCCWVKVCPACGERWESDILADNGRNYTSNTAPMLNAAALALGYVKDNEWIGEHLEGKDSLYVGKILGDCVNWMEKNEPKMIAMNPSNGWGDLTSYKHFLTQCSRDCMENPGGIVHISR